jgi:hypothetical protein
MSSKDAITRQILELLPVGSRIDFEDAYQRWWLDFRPQGGMRLTPAGFDTLCAVGEFQTHCFNVPPALLVTPRHLITLNRKLDCPYFIKTGKKPQLLVLGSEQAMMLALYGDLNKWLDFLQRQ